MTRSLFFASPVRATVIQAAVCGVALGLPIASALATTFPITPEQRSTAQEVAQAGVPLSELAPNAPDSYTVKKGDTLWDISALYLKRPWRWPELWGMNLEQIRNPHLIYPGQVLVLEKSDGRARLRMGRAVGDKVDVVRLSPRVRSGPVEDALSSVNLNSIEPFLNEAVIFDTDALALAPKVVATTEDQVLLARGNLAYAVGVFGPETEYRIFREPRPLRDPTTNEVLGFEAVFLGTADFLRPGEIHDLGSGRTEVVPATLKVTSARREIGVGDRLSSVPPRQFVNYVPHAPQQDMTGQIVSIYGEGLTAGKGQIVSLNRGARDGMQLGYVLALWREGRALPSSNAFSRTQVVLPDERGGMLFVFRVFDRMSYALIISSAQPVRPGDRFTQP